MVWILSASVLVNIALFLFLMHALDVSEAHRREASFATDSVKYWQDRYQWLAGEKPWMNNFGKKKGA